MKRCILQQMNQRPCTFRSPLDADVPLWFKPFGPLTHPGSRAAPAGFCDVGERGGHSFLPARFDNRDSGESTHLDWADTPKRRRLRRHPETAPYRLEGMADDAAAVLDAHAGAPA
jgi:hypothetical protein